MTRKSATNRLDDLSQQRELPLALLADRFDAVARLRNDAIAVVDGQRRMSYRELLLRADALARDLVARGIGPRDLVAIALPRSAELIVAVVGIVRAGAAYVPIDVNQPAERRALILSDANPKLIVTEGAQIGGIPPGIKILQLPQYVAERPKWTARWRPPDVEDPAYVIYTSGSTGQPKGVVVTQRNAARLFTITAPLFKFGANDVWTLFHSIAFDFSVWEFWGALLHGGRLVVVPATTARAADAFHALVIREGVTVLSQTPSAFRAFDAADVAAGRPGNQLRHVVFGGEALDPRCLSHWFESHGDERPRVANMYGITETTVHVTYRRMLAKDADGSGKSLIGAPLADLRIDLLGPDDRPVAVGEVGEIIVGGAGVTAGYLGRSELTAERFLPDPRGEYPNARLYRSGDLGRRMPDGDLEYLGRVDDQVKLRGFRIELGEIEAVLCKAVNVRDAVVALRNDLNREPQLIAYIVQNNCRPLDGLTLRKHVAHHLPDYMVPAACVVIENIPRTINDKVDRTALPPPLAADYASAGEVPRDDLEREIVGIWEDLLQLSPIGVRSDFFDLGGDSLALVSLFATIEARFGRRLTVDALPGSLTIARLAELLAAGTPLQAEMDPAVALQPLGQLPPFFCVHGIGGEVLHLHRLAVHMGTTRPFFGLRRTSETRLTDTISEIAARYVAAMLVHQPNGPFYLGGHSFGAVVAYEMALQLVEQGHEIGLVAVVDENRPGWRLTAREAIPALHRILTAMPRRLRDEMGRNLAANRFRDMRRILLRWLKTALGFRADAASMFDFSRFEPEQILLFEAQLRALQDYRPLPSPIPIALFRASVPSLSQLAMDPTLGWSDFAKGEVQVRTVPGNHLSMTTEPLVRQLAKALSSALDAAQGARHRPEHAKQ